MQNRRELLQKAVILPLLAGRNSAAVEIISEPNCLSEESAHGFRHLLGQRANVFTAHQLIVAAGITHISYRRMRVLRSRVEQGAWLIWESAAYGSSPNSLLEELFDLKMNRNRMPSDEVYVRYRWPAKVMIRRFGRCTLVECLPEEAIAHVADMPVASTKQIGQGRLIFLGSMLGPHLRAGDREAKKLAREILQFRS